MRYTTLVVPPPTTLESTPSLGGRRIPGGTTVLWKVTPSELTPSNPGGEGYNESSPAFKVELGLVSIAPDGQRILGFKAVLPESTAPLDAVNPPFPPSP